MTDDTGGRRNVRSRAELYDGFALVGKALAAGRRLEVLDFLSQGPRSVGQLAAELEQTVANTSQHLQVLLQAGLVTSERKDHRVIYSLRSPHVAELLVDLCDMAVEAIPEVSVLAMAHLGAREDIGWISRRELNRRMQVGDLVIIDVRPEHDFSAGHIPGAVSVPNDKLEEFAKTIDPAVEVIAYCRGEYCSLADVAVRWLQLHGHRARRLEGGFPNWIAQGGVQQRTA